MTSDWMIYGANGYTGQLCVEEALRRGQRPILAGRNDEALAALAQRHDLEYRSFSLLDPLAAPVVRAFDGVSLVLHCAGPFSATSAPMLEACERAGAHYLDVTGEIEVFEAIHAQTERWQKAKIVAMPGVGFDVVPTDCLAAELKRLVPDAVRLRLAFQTIGGKTSAGTARTMVEGLGKDCAVRREGALAAVAPGSLRRDIDFGSGEVPCAAISWGDVSTAWYTTAIPDIEVYLALPEALIRKMGWTARFGSLLQSSAVQSFLKWRVDASVRGPDQAARERSSTALWGQVEAADGSVVTMTMTCPDGYSLTAESAVDLAIRVVGGEVSPGARTPAGALGPDLVLGYRGVTRSRVNHKVAQ